MSWVLSEGGAESKEVVTVVLDFIFYLKCHHRISSVFFLYHNIFYLVLELLLVGGFSET